MSYCHEKGLFCEFARASGYCTSTGCNKLTTVTYEIRTMTPATNADHIRSMTDEELAGFVFGISDMTYDYAESWLKQPYKEDNDGR